MKEIQKIIVFCVMFALGCSNAIAQNTEATNPDTGNDTLIVDNGKTIEVAFRAANREDLLGGVSCIDMTELLSKSYELNSLGYLDKVIGGYNGNIWGMTEYLVLVDGFPRDANNVLPTEIEQITVLKSAAAVVLYGSRAAKGVIMITTKRGKAGERKISIRANTGINTPKVYPKYLGSAEYMSLYNEARMNDGLEPLYSEEDIYNYGSGSNPYRYPSVDFYSSDYLKQSYNRSEAMAEITGGGDRSRFYTTAGYYNEGSILKVGNAKNNNTSRLFARGNIDVNLHELIAAKVDANATFYDAHTANGDFWGGAASLRPNRVSPLIPISYIEANDENTMTLINASNYIIDGKYFPGGTQLDPTNPIAAAYAAGEGKYVSRQFQFNAGMDFNLRGILSGLFFRTKYGIDYASTYNQAYTNDYATYAPSWTNYNGKDVIGSLTKYGEDRKTGNENISNTAYRSTTFFSGQFDYTKVYNNEHHFYALLVANGWQRQLSGEYHRMTNINLGLQFSYNYLHKYYADFSAALPYSAKLPQGKRAGFSPTATLGWRLTEEAIFENASVFDDLVLSVSGGIINQDLDITASDNEMGYFLYESILQRGGWWSWGDLGGEAATEYNRGNNPDLTFVKRKEISIGLRGSLLNKLISFDANWFANRMDGGITRATSMYPVYFIQIGYPTSSIIPYVNYNIDNRSGVDFSVYLNRKAGEFDLTLGINGLYYTSTASRRDETYEFDYQTRVGKALNGLWGLENLGFFKDDAEAAAANQTFGEVKAGDIKYKDQNGDGRIDSNDDVFLGRWDNPLTLGLNLTAKYRNFSLFVMGVGNYGGQGFKNSSYYWVRSDNKYSEVVRDRWTEATKNTATYPRLTTANGDNNFRNSDFWLYDTDAFRLSQVQLTYDLPESIFDGKFVKGLSLYIGGYNLLTLSKESKHLETNVGSAPQTRFYNLGLKALF
jgi:TonB-linked SusC/RagA family outer membrane protein